MSQKGVESRLRSNPAVRDLWIAESKAYIVPNAALPAGGHPAEAAATLAGLEPILVDRLPFDMEGDVDVHALSRLEPDTPHTALHLDDLIQRRRPEVRTPIAAEVGPVHVIDHGDRKPALVSGPKVDIPDDVPSNFVDALIAHARS